MRCNLQVSHQWSRLCSKSELKTPSDVKALKDYLTEIWTDLAMMVRGFMDNGNFDEYFKEYAQSKYILIGLPLPDHLPGTFACQSCLCGLCQFGKTLRLRPATSCQCLCRPQCLFQLHWRQVFDHSRYEFVSIAPLWVASASTWEKKMTLELACGLISPAQRW